VVIHALCAELWVGNQPIALTQPQHSFGLPLRLVKDYARQLLEALYQQYGNERRSGFERFVSIGAQWVAISVSVTGSGESVCSSLDRARPKH
jgi:hypothetical protein